MGRKHNRTLTRNRSIIQTCESVHPNGFGRCGMMKYHGGKFHRGYVNGRLVDWPNRRDDDDGTQQ